MAEYKNQHYVPQSYLMGFTDSDINLKTESTLYRLNKETRELDRKGIKHICSENYYYSFLDEHGNYNHSTEKMLSSFENEFKKIRYRANCIRNSVLPSTEVKWFSRYEKRVLLQFIVFQLFRVPAIIDPYILQMTRDFQRMNHLEGKTQTEDEVINDIKKMALSHMFDINSRSYSIIFSLLNAKNMILTITEFASENSFVVTDNPVLITNQVERTAILNPKTEVTMTITKNIAVSFYEYGDINKCNILDDAGIEKINISFYKNATKFCLSGNQKNLEKLLLTS